MQQTETAEFKPLLALATSDSLDSQIQFISSNTALHTLKRKLEKSLNVFFSYAERFVKSSVKPFIINILEVFIIHEAIVDAAELSTM